MSFPLATEGMDALKLAQEGERLCRQSNYRAGIEYLELALKRKIDSGRESLEAVSAIYSQLGNAYFAIKDFDRALQYHLLDLDAASILKDLAGLAKAHGNIGNVYKAIGKFDKAYDHSMQHLTIAQSLGDKECEGRALYNLASVLHCQAKAAIHTYPRVDETSLTVEADPEVANLLKNAIQYYVQNLAIVEEAKDLAACGRTYGNLGNSYYMLGDYKTAVEYHERRLDLARRFGDRAAMKRAYTNLGNAYIFLNQTAKAVEYYRLALAMATELKDEVAEAQCCFNVGNGSAICGQHSSAAEYHLRYLKLSRKLRDVNGETRAYATLAADFKNLKDKKKAAYFYAVGIELASRVHDHPSEMAMRNSFESLCRTQDGNTDDDLSSVIEFDPSADPEPRSISHLNTSIQSLLCRSDCSDCGLSRRGIGDVSSIATGTEEIPPRQLDGIDEDFIEMLSRMQEKRINDQRCDPDMLSDLTNRAVRQSDTLMCTGDGDATNMTQRARRRLSGLSGFFGRLSHRRPRPLGSFRPVVASTPRQRPVSMFSLGSLKGRVSSHSESRSEDLEAASVCFEEPSKESACSSTAAASPVFRVPVAPPRHTRNRTNRCSAVSLDTAISACPPPSSKQEGMLDLIASLQGRRMEEQRAVLSNGQDGALDDELSNQDADEAGEQSGSEEMGNQLYDLVMRSQGDRLDEQRSELSGTRPDEDISQIVASMQKGRIEGQRASLDPRNAN